MTAMSVISASALAHGVHYGLIVGGLVGISALLAPALVARLRPVPAPAYDEHAVRVADLRSRIATGTLATVAPGPRPAPVSPARGGRSDLPVAVVASAAAAGVHAAVAPAHLAGGFAIGGFFLLCATAQLAWSALVLRRSTEPLLVLGVVGNVVVLLIWLASRTVGMPGVHGVEPFGPWDLACAAWELLVVGGCLARLAHGPVEDRVAPWQTWSTSALVLLGGSAFALLVLTFSGASS
ncbi:MULTISPECIES: hypothetical protein [unclassified Nocardioides]|uniref:hypothetical protein n=1 Tax=unclassified Nocardioides TaxID=2615069 RepID=UPI00301506FD